MQHMPILQRTKLNTFLHVTDSLKGCAKLCKDISRGTQISLFIKGSISRLTKTAVKCLQWLWKGGLCSQNPHTRDMDTLLKQVFARSLERARVVFVAKSLSEI